MKEKRIFRISVKIKKCEKILAEGLEPGELGFKDLEFNEEPKEYDRPLFAMGLLEHAEEFQKELIELRAREITEDEIQETDSGEDSKDQS